MTDEYTSFPNDFDADAAPSDDEPRYDDAFPDGEMPGEQGAVATWADTDTADEDRVSGTEPEATSSVSPPFRAPIDRESAVVYTLLAIVLIIGAWLRFDAQNWDDYTHLHPDERFLTDVVSSLGGPLNPTDRTTAEQDARRARCQQRYAASGDSLDMQSVLTARQVGYFDADCSTLNPNNIGKGLYVYGEFPLFTVHAAGAARSQLSRDYHALLAAFDEDAAASHRITTHWETYVGAQLIGRTVSAVADLLTILVLFLLGRRLYGRWVGLLAAAFYALAAFPIQAAHFWTVDAFTTFWVTLALYLAVRAMDDAAARQGPLAWTYLALWAGATVWDAAYRHYPVLGLATLGGVFLLVLGITAAIRFALMTTHPRGADIGDALVSMSGIFASIIYLAAWSVLVVAAPHDLSIGDGLLSVGFVSLLFAMSAWVAQIAAGAARRQSLGFDPDARRALAAGAVAVMWTALVLGYLLGSLSPWATLLLAVGAVALLIFDLTDLTDYALFGIALGGAVASRINVAPLAGIIVVAASLKALPALDTQISRVFRQRVLMAAFMGVTTAAALSFIVFRLAQPHAFLGPGVLDVVKHKDVTLLGFDIPIIPTGINFNPGWREDMSEAAYLTSGNWDAPPNHQWASRTPYFFPWRNIVQWGFGIPLGLAAWGAWAWAGIAILRGRRLWTRHAIPVAWVLVAFGWLGGRWVTTMRYFLPIYPPLALLAAWALIALAVEARRSVALRSKSRAGMAFALTASPPGPLSTSGEGESAAAVGAGLRPALGGFANPSLQNIRRYLRWKDRLAFGAAVALLIVTLGYTAVYGFAFHNIQRRQLTRVAASRWFQETIPGDLGIWVEGENGMRKLVNLGYGWVAPPPNVTHLAQGETADIPEMGTVIDPASGQSRQVILASDAVLTRIKLNRVGDPLGDPDPETLRVRLFRDDPALGRQLVYEGTISEDFAATESPYGMAVSVVPDDQIVLPALPGPGLPSNNYLVEITVMDGGPVMFVRGVTDGGETIFSDVSIGLQVVADRTLTFLDVNFPDTPILTGHGDDIPDTPTHWNIDHPDNIAFDIPIDGVIRQIDIPHLGDPLRDAGQETVRFTLIGPDGATATAVIQDDFNAGADPLGPPRTVIFNPPLAVRSHDGDGNPQRATLIVQAEDPIYTSGPVIAWEGSWDDPVPWPVCPIPDKMAFRDDLPSGLSASDCNSMNMYAGYYQGIQLWMVAEDNEQKYDAITNALDQADYLVITSNRFYDSLTRIPSRWPMTIALYEALFAGDLGFELVKTFESPPRLGPLTIQDQILPPRIPPDALNEHWESEEAFSVYDHPVVLVYRKTADYTPDRLRAVLDSVSIRSARSAVPGYVADPQPVGVVPWDAKQASAAPTLLQLPEDKLEIQREGGTWSDLFNLDALINRSEVVAVIVWWLLMVLVGWLAWPLLFAILPGLPDRAFPAAKITGWLIVAWVAWVGGTFNLLTWTRAGLFAILIALAAFNVLVIWRRRGEFWRYVRANRRHLIAVEGLTLALFVGFLGVRQGNPDLWHGSFGGEKPMDFAYFNAALRSTVFPPLDPWFSGGYINYYYFGYVIVGAPVKLLGLNPSVAYNIIIPTLYAMTGIGVFSIAYNWVRARYTVPGAIEGATSGKTKPFPLAPSPEGDSAPNDALLVRAYGDAPLPDADSPDNVGAIHELPLQDDEPPELAVGAGFQTRPYEITAKGVLPPPLREPRAPAGNPWLAGLLAVLLAVVLGNLGTVRLVFHGVAYVGGWERPALYHQVLRQELDARRTEIYQEFYDAGVARFREEHGHDPTDSGDLVDLSTAAQQKTDAYITDAANHPPLYKVWEYELGNAVDEIRAFGRGIGDVLHGAPLEQSPNAPMASNRWYWEPTRIITELPNYAGRGAIAEMPYFTFLYGDLHAHMLAFPITLLVILWMVGEIIGAGYRLRRWWESGLALGLGALAVGVLRPTNSWDWITYLLLGVAGLTYVAWVGARRTTNRLPPPSGFERAWGWIRPRRAHNLALLLFAIPLGMLARLAFYALRRFQADQQATRGLRPGETLINPTMTASSVVIWAIGAVAVAALLYVALVIALRARINKNLLLAWIGREAAFIAGTVVAALPFTMYFATAYTSVKPWTQETTPLWAYLYIHGTFVFIVISFLVWQTARWLRSVRVAQLRGLAVPVIVGGGAASLVVIGAIIKGARDVPVMQVVVPLVVWAMILFFLPRQHPLLRAIYALIALALAISLGVELVVLDGDIGRQNTVFKFYLQVWFMLSIVGGVALAWMFQVSWRWRPAARGVWQSGLAILFMIGLLYPVLATQGRFQDRFSRQDTPATLDGMEYMKYAIHGESGLWFKLEGDYDMIRWLQQNVKGTPIVMEAHQYPSEYHWNGRISIYTGLPTILGWRFHQTQQHSLPDMDKLVQTRENNTAAFYEMAGSDGIRAALDLIQTYDIEYIVVGALERAFYGDIAADSQTGLQTAGHAPGLAKFDTMADLGLLTLEYNVPRCLNTGIDRIEECPPAQVYYDRIYRVAPGESGKEQ